MRVYRNRVRQTLNALWKFKHDKYYNVMQGTTQAHFLKLLESSTLSSLLNLQKVASSKGFYEDIRQLILTSYTF
jgi:hypothetical protein